MQPLDINSQTSLLQQLNNNILPLSFFSSRTHQKEKEERNLRCSNDFIQFTWERKMKLAKAMKWYRMVVMDESRWCSIGRDLLLLLTSCWTFEKAWKLRPMMMIIEKESLQKKKWKQKGEIFTRCHVLVSFSSVYLVNCIFIALPERAAKERRQTLREENAECVE